MTPAGNFLLFVGGIFLAVFGLFNLDESIAWLALCSGIVFMIVGGIQLLPPLGLSPIIEREQSNARNELPRTVKGIKRMPPANLMIRTIGVALSWVVFIRSRRSRKESSIMATYYEVLNWVNDPDRTHEQLTEAVKAFSLTTSGDVATLRAGLRLHIASQPDLTAQAPWEPLVIRTHTFRSDEDDDIIDVMPTIKTVTPPRRTVKRKTPSEEKPTQALTEQEKFDEFLEGLTFGMIKRRKKR